MRRRQRAIGWCQVVNLSWEKSTTKREGNAQRGSRQRAISYVAREGLKTLETPIVVDDFHYVPEESKQELARAVKNSVRLTSVVMIAVPHEAFDLIRSEPDMGGRVSHLGIEIWTEFIATLASMDVEREFGSEPSESTCSFVGPEDGLLTPGASNYDCESVMPDGRTYIDAVTCFEPPPFENHDACGGDDGYPRKPLRPVP